MNDCQFMVVELRLQYCRDFFFGFFETEKMFKSSIITKFEGKVDVQNYQFWVDKF